MFRIGEFSKLVRVSPRMLRHYEKCGLLFPAEIDRFSGYRFYSATQIPLLMKITELRDLDFSIEEVRDILPHMEDTAYLNKVLLRKSDEMSAAIGRQREKLAAIHLMRSQLEKEQISMNYEVMIKEIPALTVLSLRDTLPDYSQEATLWHRLGQFMARHQIVCPALEERGYSLYHDADHRDADVDVEIAVPVEAAGRNIDAFVYRELPPVPQAAALRFGGPYEGYAKAMSKLAAWIEDNGYEICGLTRGVAIRTPSDQSDPQNYLTELQVPIQKAAGR